MNKGIFMFLAAVIFLAVACQPKPPSAKEEKKIWSVGQAKVWQDETGWLRGCNFNPSTAINQLETWQAETFDPATINRELSWAEGIGMNCMRVYLHLSQL